MNPPDPTVDEIRERVAEIARLKDQLVHDQAEHDQLRADRDNEHRLVVELRAALADKPVLHQAVGIVAEKGGVSVFEALALLKNKSRSTGRPLHDIAQSIVAHHDQSLQIPGPAPRDVSPSSVVAGPGGPAGRPTDASRPGHPDCALCAGEADGGAWCQLYHDLVDLRDEISIHGVVFQ